MRWYARLTVRLFAVTLWWLYFGPAAAAQGNGNLQIHYINVGQGDATLVISPQGATVLIDNGPGGCSGLIGYLQGLHVARVDVHVASHYHVDHIACTPQVLSTFPLWEVALDRGGFYSTTTYKNYVSAVGTKRQTVLTKHSRLTLGRCCR